MIIRVSNHFIWLYLMAGVVTVLLSVNKYAAATTTSDNTLGSMPTNHTMFNLTDELGRWHWAEGI